MFNVALIGAWHVHFKEYANMLNEMDYCNITCIWDNNEERGKGYAETYGCEFVGNYDELLARSDVDAVMFCTETSLHREMIPAAAKSKKHIFTEKVLCFTRKEAEEVAKIVEESGVKFCICFPHICEAEYLAVKKIIADGELGDITYARYKKAHDGVSRGWLPPSFFVKEDCGGGAMMDLGAHPMYILSDLLGEVDSVKAIFTQKYNKGVDDNAVALLKFGSTIAVSETSFVTAKQPITLEISGTKGSLIWGGGHDKLIVTSSDSNEFITPELPEAMPHPLTQWAMAVNDESCEILPGLGLEPAIKLSNLMELAYKDAENN